VTTFARSGIGGREVPVMPVVLAVSVVALALGLSNLVVNGTASGTSPPATRIAVSQAGADQPIPSGFLGLSLEFNAIKPYAGTNPASIDQVLVQLIRNLAPGQRPVLRIGGDSADRTWWPVPGLARPPGVTYALDDDWLRVTRALERELDARVIFGINLEANSPELAATEARQLLGGSDPGAVQALELGNEPELYAEFPWYRAGGHGVPGRPPGYDFSAFLNDFGSVSAALEPVALAGPTTGGPGWIPNLRQFLSDEPKVALVTLHRYPLQLCFTGTRSPHYPTIAHLLSAAASTGLAASFGSQVAVAHARGRALRVDELNSVSCGADPAVSYTFASALWVLDTLFEMARVGVDGVNIHTFPGAGYELYSLRFTGGRWEASISPEYYGLLMFAAAAPPGSRLLSVSGPIGRRLKAWATVAPDGRLRVVLINKDPGRSRLIALSAPRQADGSATVERLQAPSVASSGGVTLAGQSFGEWTSTGRLAGTARVSKVTARGGRYHVSVPAGSAALITFGRSR
jgi:Glycosyl hydrolase family 79 C-terminal beta domain